MDDILISAFSVLQITMIDVVLSGDNMGVIALAVRKLPKAQAKVANIVGVCGAILLRIVFASVITTLLMIDWLPIKFIGGLLLLKITWNLIRLNENEENVEIEERKGLWTAIYNIIMADMSVSLDNVLAVGGVAQGNIVLIIFGLLFNIPIIFFGSQLVVRLIQKYKITIFIGAGILVHTAIKMMMEDKLISCYMNQRFADIVSWGFAGIIILIGILQIHKGTDLR